MYSCDIISVLSFSVLKTLIKLKKDSPDYISIKALSKIKETIIRLGIYKQLTIPYICFILLIFFNRVC